MLILIVAMAYFMEWLDASALNTALPQIAFGFHVNPIILKEALTAYLLSVGIFIPVSGYLCDRFGIKPSFMSAIVVFMLGSIGCSFSTSVPMLVGFRIMQGIGGALLTPVGRMVLLKSFGAERFAEVISKVSLLSAIAMMLGPVFGGALSSYVDWRWIFWLNIPFCLLTIFLVIKSMPVFEKPEHVARFDLYGFVLIALALAFALYTLDVLVDPHIQIWIKLLFTIVSAIGFILFAHHIKVKKHPLLTPDLFRIRRFSWTAIASFLVRLGISTPPFLVPLLLQAGYHFNAFVSGLLILPVAIAIGATKFIAKPVAKRFGAKQALYVTTLGNAVVLALYYFVIQDHVVIWALVVLNFLTGAGFSIQATLMNSVLYQSVPKRLHSNAVPTNSAVIQLSTSFAVAIAAVVLATMMGRMDFIHHIPLSAFRVGFLVEAVFPLLALWCLKKAFVKL